MSVGSRLAIATDGMRTISESSDAIYSSESAALSADSSNQSLSMDDPISFIAQDNDSLSLIDISDEDNLASTEGDDSISLD